MKVHIPGRNAPANRYLPAANTASVDDAIELGGE